MAASPVLPRVGHGIVKGVPGVQDAVPVLYAEATIDARGRESIVYILGVPPGATIGGPWRIVEGNRRPGTGEVVLDRAIANRSGVRVGDEIKVLGRPARIAGLTAGTSSLVSSLVFVPFADFAAVRGEGEIVSYVLVRVAPGERLSDVAAAIRAAVGDATVQTSAEFASEERKIVEDMSADIVGIMNSAGYATGLAVVVLTIYMATISRRREYAVLKAIGIRNEKLLFVVLIQALVSVFAGLLVAIALSLLLVEVIPRLNELIVLSLEPGPVVRAAITAMVLAAVASLLPAFQLARIEPITAMRRG